MEIQHAKLEEDYPNKVYRLAKQTAKIHSHSPFEQVNAGIKFCSLISSLILYLDSNLAIVFIVLKHM